ncbi:MAG: hypothetical protein ACOYNX_09925 [Geothrix sp.]|nr:hypothetical protein [Acidobacteriota bacterium]
MARILFVGALALCLGVSAQPQDDPVLRARAQRAAAQGIAEGDLPPVPRGIVEPPPLPPPEPHVKDTRKGKASAKAKAKAKGQKGKATKGKAAAKPKAKAKPVGAAK